MKYCCVVTYVFGSEYQSFIPLYIYSINLEYPDYDIVIYVDRELDKKYQQNLAFLGAENYKIRQFSPNCLGLTEKAIRNYNISRAIRFMLMNEEYLDYSSIYSGDIDIFISHEDSPLYEQHIRHADYIKLPYSNCIRSYCENNSIKHLLGNVVRYGVIDTYRTAVFPIRKWYRLTGLHFMKTKECNDKIQDYLPTLVKKLNDVAAGKSDFWTMPSIYDESILYELMKGSGIGVPDNPAPEQASGLNLVQNRNPESVYFRPHHGLHLALWKKAIPDEAIPLSNVYVNYYLDFMKKLEEHSRLRQLISQKDNLCTTLIDRMLDYYRDRIS